MHIPLLLLPVHVHSAFRLQFFGLRSCPHAAWAAVTGAGVGYAVVGAGVISDVSMHIPLLLLPVHVHSAFRLQFFGLRSCPHAAWAAVTGAEVGNAVVGVEVMSEVSMQAPLCVEPTQVHVPLL